MGRVSNQSQWKKNYGLESGKRSKDNPLQSLIVPLCSFQDVETCAQTGCAKLYLHSNGHSR